MSSFDTLPSELQREVFEWATVESGRRVVSMATTLSLVCRRVNIWMDYIIYRNVFLDFEYRFYLFARTFDAKPADFFRERVHSLGIDVISVDAEDIVQKIIETCSNICSLWWLSTPRDGDLGPDFVKGHPRLQMLSILNHKITLAVATDPSYHSWRQSLRILDTPIEPALEIDFRAFPNLTILSIWSSRSVGYEEGFSQTLTKILEQNSLLECLVLGIDGAERYESKGPEHVRILRSAYSTVVKDIQDPRLVVLPCLTFMIWTEEVSNQRSYWDLARLEVQRQRKAVCSTDSL